MTLPHSGLQNVFVIIDCKTELSIETSTSSIAADLQSITKRELFPLKAVSSSLETHCTTESGIAWRLCLMLVNDGAVSEKKTTIILTFVSR